MNMEKEFESGKVVTTSTMELLESRDFSPHPSFGGVALKLLVDGAKTSSALSLHLVRIEPHCCLESHTHPQSLEIHQVICGDGTVVIGDNLGEYHPGTVGVIPAGIPHKVTAGAQGLFILAVFTPALA